MDGGQHTPQAPFGDARATVAGPAKLPRLLSGGPARPPSSPAAPGLTDLALRPSGGRRPFHALAYQSPLRFAGRVLSVGAEIAWALARDRLAARGHSASQVVRFERGGAAPATGGRRVALYAHYAPSHSISPMVQQQLALYREQGLDVVFATNSACIDEQSWQDAAQHCCWMVQRRNLGLDFGAWRDAAALVIDRSAPPDELLLVNDSVLGPIHPLGPLFARARAVRAGAVGLTESHQGGVHLQSYFVLLLGRAATVDALGFLAALRLSRGKWLMVQRGEFGLSRHLLRRGHRVCALFGYAQALDAILACPAERGYLAALAPRVGRDAGQGGSHDGKLREALLRWPLNPTHHLWRGLPQCLGFPFLKTALISRNPGRLLGLEGWPTLVGGEAAPCLQLLTGHLAQLQAPWAPGGL